MRKVRARGNDKALRSSIDRALAVVKFQNQKPVVSSTQNPYSLYFWVPMLPKIHTNGAHGHWSKKYRAVSALKGRVHYLIMEHVPPKALDKAKVTLIRYGSVEPDFDNLVASFKPVIDGLVLAGVLANDKQANIGQPDYQFVKGKRAEGAFSVKVEEI